MNDENNTKQKDATKPINKTTKNTPLEVNGQLFLDKLEVNWKFPGSCLAFGRAPQAHSRGIQTIEKEEAKKNNNKKKNRKKQKKMEKKKD